MHKNSYKKINESCIKCFMANDNCMLVKMLPLKIHIKNLDFSIGLINFVHLGFFGLLFVTDLI